jgi:hypothetical protein
MAIESLAAVRVHVHLAAIAGAATGGYGSKHLTQPAPVSVLLCALPGRDPWLGRTTCPTDKIHNIFVHWNEIHNGSVMIRRILERQRLLATTPALRHDSDVHGESLVTLRRSQRDPSQAVVGVRLYTYTYQAVQYG